MTRRNSIRVEQFDTLDVMDCIGGGVTIRELEARTGKTYDALKKQLQRLCRAGLVRSERERGWQTQAVYHVTTLAADAMNAKRWGAA